MSSPIPARNRTAESGLSPVPLGILHTAPTGLHVRKWLQMDHKKGSKGRERGREGPFAVENAGDLSTYREGRFDFFHCVAGGDRQDTRMLSTRDGVEGLRQTFERKPWREEGATPAWKRPISMLNMQEERMLAWLAENYYRGDGAIVEGGTFLGGSTMALGSGLRRNPRVDSKEGRIHSFDIFIVPDAPWALSLLGEGSKPGDRIQDRYEENVRSVRDLVSLHPGNIKTFEWSGEPVEILFVDVAKCWGTNQVMMSQFYPHLLPGRSLVIHQDYVTQYVPWVHLSMELLSDCLEPLGRECTSQAFLCIKPLPEEWLQKPLRDALTLEQKRDLLEKAAARFPDGPCVFIAGAHGMLLFMESGVDPALRWLDNAKKRYGDTFHWSEQVLEDVEKMIRFWNVGQHLEHDMNNKFERYLDKERG